MRQAMLGLERSNFELRFLLSQFHPMQGPSVHSMFDDTH